MKNKILAFLLAACLVVGTAVAVPTTSYAASDSASNKAVMFLTQLGIMKGDIYTGEFWDDSLVKRFEIAQILCKLFDYDVATSKESMFSDVGEADRAYVETVVANGLMSGYGDGKFGPNDYVTNEQIVKIFVDVIGGREYAAMMGGYPMGYLKTAKKLGISNGISITTDQTARRMDVAQIIYNALHVDIIQLQGFRGEFTDYGIIDGETMLTEIMNVATIKGEVTAIDSTSLKRPSEGTGDAKAKINGELLFDPDYIADEYLGCNVVAYARKDKATGKKTLIYIEEASDNNIIEVNGSDLISVEPDQITYYDGSDRERTADISPVVDMVHNGIGITFDKNKIKKISDVSVKLIDNDGDNVIDFINVTEYENFVISLYKPETKTLYFDYSDAPIKLENCYLRLFYNGVAIKPEELEEGMVASIAKSSNITGKKALRIECSDASVMGSASKVETKSGVMYATIANKEYVINTKAITFMNNNLLAKLKAGSGGQFYLNVYNEIVYYTGGGESGAIGYFVAANKKKNAFDSELQFKIYTDKGKMEIYTAKSRLTINGDAKRVKDLVSDGNVDWANLCNQAMGKQLIRYSVSDGIIKEIIYCDNTVSYDPQKFSLDASGSMSVTKKDVMDYKYMVNSDTKVFCVPSNGSQEVKDYNVTTGSYFVLDNSYNVKLYDITPYGKVTYAMVTLGSGATITKVSYPFMFVTEVETSVNSDGEVVKVATGIDPTSGKTVTITSMPGEDLYDFSTPTKKVEKGDFIQYYKNSLGYVGEIKIGHKSSDSNHIGWKALHSNAVQLSYGYAANISATTFCVTESPRTDQISPSEASTIVSAGSRIYIYSRAKEVLAPATFADIVPGDEIFAMCRNSNTTEFIIIYR